MVHFSRQEILKTVRKLEGLSVDLREIADGNEPNTDLLQTAPILEQWSIMPAPFRVLVGHVSGHPTIKDGEVMTSQLFLIEDTKSWARTFSRYYRLGERAAWRS